VQWLQKRTFGLDVGGEGLWVGTVLHGGWAAKGFAAANVMEWQQIAGVAEIGLSLRGGGFCAGIQLSK
jgi:hypothetical protein